MRRYILIIIIVLGPYVLLAQNVELRAWFDSTSILIGDQVNYNIEISHTKDISIIYPEISDTLTDGLEIIQGRIADTVSGSEENILVRLQYLITSFDTGFYEVPPQYAEVRTSEGISRYYSDYSHLEVLRSNIIPGDSTQVIFDISGPRKAGITFMEILPWILIILLVILIIIFAKRYLGRRNRREKDDSSYLSGEPLHIIALRELDKLEKKELWQKSHHKPYYSGLTEILRKYIDNRYGITSLEMTTDETLDALLEKDIARDNLFIILERIFHTADLSKFAKYKAEDGINIQSLEDARYFIKNTYLNEETEEIVASNMESEEVSDE